MHRRLLWTLSALALTASSASAQVHRAEIGAFGGYTLSDGVTFPGIELPLTGQIFNAIEPKDGLSYGLEFGVFVAENFQVGGLWSRQDSTLVAKGAGQSMEVADMDVANYHGIFTYYVGEDYETVRPYLFGGLGATRYKSFEIEGREIDGETRFSTTWGAGLKAYPGNSVGLNLRFRWTPTYIKSDPAGYWCDPYWGCFTVSDAQFSNQFEFSGGLSFRF